MSSNQEVVVISIGSKLHPFLYAMIERDDIAVTYITNTVCDFSIYHADPSKILDYHLEFINIISQKAKRSMESVNVFETLGQFFEFYNPLHLSTLNYLFSKYATNVKQQTKNLTEVWKNISKIIFEKEFIYPLFDEIRQIHVKEGDIEIPVRQLLLKYSKQQEEKKNGKINEEIINNITGIIDIDEINKLKINPIVSKKIEQAPGIIIVPSDLISLFLVFQSSSFRETLKKTSGEIAILSPFFEENNNLELEKAILKKSNFEPTLVNFVNLIGNVVDTIIIDKKNSSQVAKLREAGITVLVDNLSSERMQSHEFLELILRSIEIEPESVYMEPVEIKEGFGDKIVNLLSSRFTDTVIQNKEDKEVIETETEEEKEKEIGESIDIKEAEVSSEEQSVISEKGKEEKSVKSTAVSSNSFNMRDELKEDLSEIVDFIDINDNIVNQFEMEVDGSEETVEKKEKSASELVRFPEEIPVVKQEEKRVEFFLPGIDEIEKAELQDINSLEADESIINAYIDRAILSNDVGVEIAFSDLLSLQNNEMLVDKIYKILMERLTKSMEFSTESKLTNIITYLAAHKPAYYIEKFKELLEETIFSAEYESFIKLSEKASLIIGKSYPVGEEVVKEFILKYIEFDDFYIEEKLRLIVRDFFPCSEKTRKAISNTLLSILYEELKKEEKNQKKLRRLVSMISMLDAHIIGLELVQIFKEEDFDLFTSIIKSGSFTQGFQHIVLDIMKAYQETNIEQLKNALHGLKLPKEVQSLLIKESYKRSLSKVGSISLDIFAEQSGLTPEKAEKLIYEMIMKGEIKAKLELVNERLYIVQEKQDTLEEVKQKTAVEIPKIKSEVQVVDAEQEIEAVSVKEKIAEQQTTTQEKVIEFAKPSVQPSTPSPDEPSAELVVQPSTEPVVQPSTEPVVQPSTEPAPQQITQVPTHPKKENNEVSSIITILGKRVQPIIDAGYNSLEKIAHAEIGDLVKIKGVGEKTALNAINKAKKYLEG
ncbi:MAG: helix-hairpin-helix domain-containing protein [Candidatus Heimdallarchaeaceae archaeon]